ncbi:hypothetical protein [Dongia sp.]|uniref:hypothetical protein n=1 Tax=Dongia sp. TaxID=1977262 RepID=UPI0035B2EAF5
MGTLIAVIDLLFVRAALQGAFSLSSLSAMAVLLFVANAWYGAVFVSCLQRGSPLDHIEIDQEGIRRRYMLRSRKVRWDEIGQFAVLEHIPFFDRARRRSWFLLVEPLKISRVDSDRIRRALFAVDAAEFGPMSATGQETGALLADWLNELLTQSRRAPLPDQVSVPRELLMSVSEYASGLGEKPPLGKARRSTVER